MEAFAGGAVGVEEAGQGAQSLGDEEGHDDGSATAILRQGCHQLAIHGRIAGQRIEGRQFLDTRPAPAGPEIEDDEMAAEFGEAVLAAVIIYELYRRRWYSCPERGKLGHIAC